MKSLCLLLALALPSSALAGGSGWEYFVPYESDTASALQKLRWDVFKKGKYYKVFPKKKAKSPDHALEISETEGTHSIIDMQKVAPEPGATCAFGTLCPLTPAAIKTLFGSDKPTRAQVEAASSKIGSHIPRWTGMWVIAYDGVTPKWLYFAGVSGD
jgi:hypothetical protein